jgi:hypothetical protein
MLNPIELTLDLDTVEYLLSYLDDEPQGTVINNIREEIFRQTYE